MLTASTAYIVKAIQYNCCAFMYNAQLRFSYLQPQSAVPDDHASDGILVPRELWHALA